MPDRGEAIDRNELPERGGVGGTAAGPIKTIFSLAIERLRVLFPAFPTSLLLDSTLSRHTLSAFAGPAQQEASTPEVRTFAPPDLAWSSRGAACGNELGDPAGSKLALYVVPLRARPRETQKARGLQDTPQSIGHDGTIEVKSAQVRGL